MDVKTEATKESKEKVSQVYLEKEGERHVKNILTSLDNVPLGVSLLQLAWTAGPVTFLALQGGYYIGYGKIAPIALFAYFGAYTLIAGLFGVGVSIFHSTIKAKRLKVAKKNLLFTIDQLVDLMFDFSDYRLKQLSEAERKFAAAHILLKNTHAYPDTVSIAIEELTEDKQIARTIKKIEIFRRAGLFSRIADLVDTLKDQAKSIVQVVDNTHPEIARALAERFSGQAPTLKQGLPRKNGFIERIFTAAEYDDLEIMSLEDAEEMLILVFELLNDREIQILTFTYRGNKKLRTLTTNLERTRAAYRISNATFTSRLRSLFSYLLSNKIIVCDTKVSLSEMLQQIFRSLNILSDIILKENIYLIKHKILEDYLQLYHAYKLLYSEYKILINRQKQFQQAVKNWQKHTLSLSDLKTALRFGRGSRGLRIKQEEIYLDDKKKLLLVNKVTKLIKAFIEERKIKNTNIGDAIKQFTVSLACTVDPYINLSKPVIQYGLESSNATNFCSLELGISGQAKAGAAKAMVQEVESDTSRSAEKLAEVLIKHYDEDLDENAIRFLTDTYGAKKSHLYMLKAEKQNQKNHIKMYQNIPTVYSVDRSWVKARDRVLKYIK